MCSYLTHVVSFAMPRISSRIYILLKSIFSIFRCPQMKIKINGVRVGNIFASEGNKSIMNYVNSNSHNVLFLCC